jgi:hypothetical protein
MPEKEIFCGIGNIPKKARRGTMQECAEKGQIRYYGVKKIDPRLLEAAKEEKKNRKPKGRDAIIIKIMTIKGKINKQKKIYDGEKDKDKKEKIKKEIEKLKKDLDKLSDKASDYEKKSSKKSSKKVSRSRSAKRGRSSSRKRSRSHSTKRSKSRSISKRRSRSHSRSRK